MAHNRSYKPEDILFPDQHITQSNLVDEMEKSYIEYAMSVIVGRALPDVRDGLKPVHRRILYTMYEILIQIFGNISDFRGAKVAGHVREDIGHDQRGSPVDGLNSVTAFERQEHVHGEIVRTIAIA